MMPMKIKLVMLIGLGIFTLLAKPDWKKPDAPPPEQRTNLPLYGEKSSLFSTHTVAGGESIAGIAERHNLKQGSVISANRLHTGDLKAGGVLHIPNEDGVSFFLPRKDTQAGNAFFSFIQKHKDLTGNISEVKEWGNDDTTVFFVKGAEMETADIQAVYGGRYYMPVEGGSATSLYGLRPDPFDAAKTSFHGGIDIGAPGGTAVRASKYGKVAETGAGDMYGNYAIIAHDHDYQTFYGHLDRIDVKAGDGVMTGDRIGTMGNTGKSTGVHLHFAIMKNGNALDPLSVNAGIE